MSVKDVATLHVSDVVSRVVRVVSEKLEIIESCTSAAVELRLLSFLAVRTDEDSSVGATVDEAGDTLSGASET